VGQSLARLALLLTVAAIGCGGEERSTTTDESRVPGPSDNLVVYERTGGVAGIQERVLVRPDGAVRVETGPPSDRQVRRFDLKPGELDDLRGAVAQADFPGLDSQYGTDPPPNDAFERSITADGRTVRVLHGAKLPEGLERVLDLSAALVHR
jgi:hypothetical protein